MYLKNKNSLSVNAPAGTMMEMWGTSHLSNMYIGAFDHNIAIAWTNLQGLRFKQIIYPNLSSLPGNK